MRRWLGLTLKFVLSALLIVVLLGAVDLEAAWSKMTDASPLLVLSGTLILTFQLVVSAIRWRAVLRALGASLGFLEAIKILYIGTFFNQTLPSSVGGDAVRMYKTHKAGLSLSASINGVMLERLATVLGLLLLVVICQPFFYYRIDVSVPLWAFPLLTGMGIMGTALLMFLDRLPPSMSRLRWVRGLAYLAADTRRVFLRPRYALYIVATAVVGHANIALGVWVLGMSLGLGDQLSLLDCLVLIPTVLLVTTLPISIAGWGVREGSMVAAFGLIGISSESALVLSILFGLVMIAIALPGGIIWLADSDCVVPVEDGGKENKN